MRGLALLAAAAVVSLAAGACSPAARTPSRDARALVQVDCPITDAMVWIDDTAVGEVRELRGGVAVRPGAHRIEIRHDRFHTRYFLVTLRQGEAHTVRVTMAELLD